MSDNKRTGRGYGKGYYIALILCAAAIGITGYLYYQTTAGEDAPLLQTEPDAVVADTEADVPAIATQPSGETVIQNTEPSGTAQPRGLQTMAPVQGQQVMDYSMEALSYNQTTRDWRVHNGVDFAAEAGTEVVAAADGEVYTIYEDDSMGVTVVIRHLNGYNTHYSSLSPELAVSVGEQVTMGQVIGTVGNTALVETVLGPHVHFSVTYQDLPIDPAEFLALNG